MLGHVCVWPSEEIGGGIAFLGHNIVGVDGATRDRGGAEEGKGVARVHEPRELPYRHVSLLLEAP